MLVIYLYRSRTAHLQMLFHLLIPPLHLCEKVFTSESANGMRDTVVISFDDRDIVATCSDTVSPPLLHVTIFCQNFLRAAQLAPIYHANSVYPAFSECCEQCQIREQVVKIHLVISTSYVRRQSHGNIHTQPKC